jgi:hypothetical protein
MQTGNRLQYVPFNSIRQPRITANFCFFGNNFFSIFQIFSDFSKVT